MAEKKSNGESALAKAEVPFGALGFAPTNMTEAFRFADALSQSKLVPLDYQGNRQNCMIALDIAARIDTSWMVVMQHVYTVHERPAMDAALVISLVNRSGVFVDPIEYEVEGTDPKKDDYRVRAYATRKKTKKKLYGPWIDWALVRGEGWDQRKGSKWITMPDQMFHYRAASWFQRRYVPEIAMGMLTTDEASDTPRHVESTVVEKGIQGLKDRLDERDAATETESEADDIVIDEGKPATERDPETEAKVQEQKAALGVDEATEPVQDAEDPPADDEPNAAIF